MVDPNRKSTHVDRAGLRLILLYSILRTTKIYRIESGRNAFVRDRVVDVDIEEVCLAGWAE